ncbi:PLP-dependent aminotransferase family protein [Iningainema tapete]|uniref:PLP-dependent aminotransferase family protein n=1 Tax=Iningainema tapete BLCC-T55 TaxID=2748662 RepID=A0A8J7C7W2_9CYAN|nr:PLP-dependent aminotransferase family protein [Iningainema tapete]MBD2776249.1 PLP-dependent aminotransferase family protein [Iningainema tapete BLCC-T55]
MKIFLDRQSPKPIYMQIHDRLSNLIQSGALQPGDRLPSIRSLAESVQVNKLTIIEAYNVLEAEGVICARQGSGYFVETQRVAATNLKPTFAPAQDVIIKEPGGNSFFDLHMAAVQAQTQPGMINLSFGFPRPPKDITQIAKRALNQTDALHKYDLPQGQTTLRRQITQMLIHQGLNVSTDDLIVTNGSEQALSLAMHYFVQPGDWVIVEAPTYFGAIAILENLGAKIIGIPMTAEGINLELLEQYLKSHCPKLIYTISTLHNPTGLTTSPEHRQQLLALAQQYECPILEDNAYEGLNFEPVPAPIKALDQNDLVTYVGTFSKTLMPGIRVGYMVVTGKHYQAILERKLFHDVHVSTVSQAIVSEYLASGHYRRHLNQLRTENLQSRNFMVQAMERYFPEEAKWTVPKGGLFLWVQLPADIPIQTISKEALAQNVLIFSGSAFFPDKQGYSAMRLTFANSLEEIEQGISILGKLLKKHLYRGQEKLFTHQYPQLFVTTSENDRYSKAC